LILEEEDIIAPESDDGRELRRLDMDVESSSRFTMNGDGSVQMAGAPDAAVDTAPVAWHGGGAVGVVVEGSHRCLRLRRSVPFFGVRLATMILGTRASYKRMLMGPTTQKFRVVPNQNAREGGGADLVLRLILTREINPTWHIMQGVEEVC
jgi:hypothetical protein